MDCDDFTSSAAAGSPTTVDASGNKPIWIQRSVRCSNSEKTDCRQEGPAPQTSREHSARTWGLAFQACTERGRFASREGLLNRVHLLDSPDAVFCLVRPRLPTKNQRFVTRELNRSKRIRCGRKFEEPTPRRCALAPDELHVTASSQIAASLPLTDMGDVNWRRELASDSGRLCGSDDTITHVTGLVRLECRTQRSRAASTSSKSLRSYPSPT